MKNPLEFSLLEIERLMADDEPENVTGPHKAYNELLLYIRNRIVALKLYQVQETARVVQRKEPEAPSARIMRAMDQELLDAAEIVYESLEDQVCHH